MSFKIINGGNKSLNENKKDISREVEQLKLFVSHMRAIENSITSVNDMASSLKWPELNVRLIQCKKQILETLAFVRNSTKSKIQQRDNIDKPNNRNYLKIVSNKE